MTNTTHTHAPAVITGVSGQPTKQQEAALKYVRRFLEEHGNIEGSTLNPYITKYTVEYHTWGISVTCTKEQGEPGTYLHLLSHQYWLIFIGKRGAITVKMGPKSFIQFNGRKAYNMNVDIRA